MKKLLFIILACYSYSCRDEKVEPAEEPFRPEFLNWEYTAQVNINGSDVLKYLKAVKGRCYYSASPDSTIGILMTSTDQYYNYYYDVVISNIAFTDGMHRLYDDDSACTRSSMFYYKACCYSNPDAIGPAYYVNEADSLNNFIRIHIDTATKELSGMFQANLIVGIGLSNGIDPDTIIMRCDTFYCKYALQ